MRDGHMKNFKKKFKRRKVKNEGMDEEEGARKRER